MRRELLLSVLVLTVSVLTLYSIYDRGSEAPNPGKCDLLVRDIENTLKRFERVKGSDAAMRQLIDALKADLEYMKLCRKPELFERFAPEGVQVPLVYITDQGFNVHAINAMNLATEAISYRRNWSEFKRVMDWMLRYMERKGNASFFNFYFAWERDSIPWNSSFSQGIAAGYYAVAYGKFKDARYYEAAKSLVNSFLIPYEDGGFVLETAYGPFYLEYSNAPDDLVLNGFMLSLKGLAIYDSLIGDVTSAKTLKEGIETLRRILPEYEEGGWSLYSPKHGRATEVYHRLHIRLLYFLGRWFEDELLLSYAWRWDSYLTLLSSSELPRAEWEYLFWRELVGSLRASLTESPDDNPFPQAAGVRCSVVVLPHVESGPHPAEIQDVAPQLPPQQDGLHLTYEPVVIPRFHHPHQVALEGSVSLLDHVSPEFPPHRGQFSPPKLLLP